MAIINTAGIEGRTDFTGFTFNNKHSSEFRIIRVSSSSRYQDTLLTATKDTTVDIPGRDGLLYFNSKFQQRQFTINFAFDDLHEDNIRALRQWLSVKYECDLWFDELPYKVYKVKCTSAPQINFIAFDEFNDVSNIGKRVYKGEGTVQFTAYYPWAYCAKKYIDEYSGGTYIQGSINQWKDSSGLLQTDNHNYDEIKSDDSINLYNAGDIDTPFRIMFEAKSTISSLTGATYLQFNYDEDGSTSTTAGAEPKLILDLNILNQQAQSGWSDAYEIDSETHLIVGYDKNETSGGEVTYTKNNKLYNYLIVAGDFFNIMPGESLMQINTNNAITIVSPYNGKSIDYNYLYY